MIDFTKFVFATFAILVGVWLGNSAIAFDEARPNVLLIVVDDQSPFDLKAYDSNSPLDSPNIDRIAKSGVVIDSAYHMGSFSGAVCTPSRHMIMTGRTVWHLPIGPRKIKNKNYSSGQHCPDNIIDHCLAEVFNRAGYDTMRTCKKGNSYKAANKRFKTVRDATKRGGTAETGSEWHGKQVLDYLDRRQSEKADDPFLIYFGFSHPHDKRDGTPELLAKYGATNHTDKESPPPANDKQPKLPVNYLASHPFKIGHPKLRDEVAVSGVWERRDERTIRNEIGRQFACNENIDIQIGRVLEKLETMGELENTYVIYTSDHGMAIGRHGLQGKQNLYQHTWRVPMIAMGPGIRKNHRADGNVYLLDILSTLCELTNVDKPDSSEGTSFAPVLQGSKQTVRDVLYGVYSGGTKPGMRCVRKGDWKLIKYDVLDGTVRETQLFNLAENPEEFLVEHHDPSVAKLLGASPTSNQINLANVPEHQDKLEEMEALLQSEMQRLHDPYELWNQTSEKK